MEPPDLEPHFCAPSPVVILFLFFDAELFRIAEVSLGVELTRGMSEGCKRCRNWRMPRSRRRCRPRWPKVVGDLICGRMRSTRLMVVSWVASRLTGGSGPPPAGGRLLVPIVDCPRKFTSLSRRSRRTTQSATGKGEMVALQPGHGEGLVGPKSARDGLWQGHRSERSRSSRRLRRESCSRCHEVTARSSGKRQLPAGTNAPIPGCPITANTLIPPQLPRG